MSRWDPGRKQAYFAREHRRERQPQRSGKEEGEAKVTLALSLVKKRAHQQRRTNFRHAFESLVVPSAANNCAVTPPVSPKCPSTGQQNLCRWRHASGAGQGDTATRRASLSPPAPHSVRTELTLLLCGKDELLVIRAPVPMRAGAQQKGIDRSPTEDPPPPTPHPQRPARRCPLGERVSLPGQPASENVVFVGGGGEATGVRRSPPLREPAATGETSPVFSLITHPKDSRKLQRPGRRTNSAQGS
ncbi:uncharacterized protein LOC142559529 isoform X1 [Dermacentor variabilis]|uniref:uncharacterized protein LOC142559529 isoform X1 n=1 Tax=Dermacentor variabilis TaxID=34621 RepID=UPI003F5B9FC5